MRIEDEVARLKEEVRGLKAAIKNVPLRPAAGGGGGMVIKEYETFPEIPSKPTLIWCKGQVWSAGEGDTKWKPDSDFTAELGTPGT